MKYPIVCMLVLLAVTNSLAQYMIYPGLGPMLHPMLPFSPPVSRQWPVNTQMWHAHDDGLQYIQSRQKRDQLAASSSEAILNKHPFMVAMLVYNGANTIEFKEAMSVKEFLKDPSKFLAAAAAAVPPTSAAAVTSAATARAIAPEKDKNKEETEEEEDDDMGFGLFD